MFKSKRCILRFLSLVILGAFLINPSYGQGFLLELSLGDGIWGGPWDQAIKDTDDSLGLETRPLLIPALSSSLIWHGPILFGPVRFGANAGLGLWTGSLAGFKSIDLEQAHSILAFALEARPMISAAIPIRRGSLLTDLSLGSGIVIGPIVAIDDLPGFRSVSKVSPEFLRRFFGIAGLGLAYRTTGPFSYGLRGDAALASFDSTSGSKPTWMWRFMVSVAYLLPAKEME